MKNWKKMLSLALAICLVASLFAACSTPKTENTPSPQPSQSTEQQPSGNQTAPSSQDSQSASQPQDDEELVEINFWMAYGMGVMEESDNVVAAINEITEREINTHVNITYTSLGDYMQNLGMSLASGESVDVFVRAFGPLGFGGLFANHQLLDLTDYMDTYGAELLALLGDELLDPFRVNGRLYALPPYRAMNEYMLIGMRKDILEELGMVEFASNMSSWSDYEQLMQAVADRYVADGLYPVVLPEVSGADGIAFRTDRFDDGIPYDNVGDSLNVIAAFDDGKIEPLFWSDAQVDMYERYVDWTNRGYVWPESIISTDPGTNAITNGVAFSEIFVGAFDSDVSKTALSGYPYMTKKIGDVYIGTDMVTRFGLGVNVNTEEPEACVKFLNLLYTNTELMNLLVFGEEGKNYVVGTDGMADYPESGILISAKYHMDDFMVGNQFLLKPWAGTTVDYREISLENFKNAKRSPFMGFTMNTAELSTTIASLSAVIDQYRHTLNSGGYTPELLSEMQNKLKAADIDLYIQTAQDQLDAWVASH